MIEGLTRPDAGTIEILGDAVWPDPRRVQRRIGVQLQKTALFDNLYAGELLALFCDLYGVPHEPRAHRVVARDRRTRGEVARARPRAVGRPVSLRLRICLSR